MTPRSPISGATLAVILALAAGCGRETGNLAPTPPNTDPVVFSDTFGDGVDFQAFLYSKYDALEMDTVERYQGTASLKVTVPGPGEGFAGGAFVAGGPRDLSGYNALTFWTKASKPAALNVGGLGNDNTGTSKFEASRANIPVSTGWTQVVIPIPNPARLDRERGLFYFSEDAEAGQGYTLWFDEVRFASVPGISNPKPVLENQSFIGFVGSKLVPKAHTTFDVGVLEMLVQHQIGYFDMVSSDEAVAKPGIGVIDVVGGGNAVVTANLAGVDATGEVTVEVRPSPTAPAPVPSLPANQVISIFSNKYVDVAVDKWLADWSQNYAKVQDLQINGDDVKVYTDLVYAGIEFTSSPVDASAMDYFHIDLWAPAGTTEFRVKLVDFGSDGVYTNGSIPDDITESELTINSGSTPPLVTATWVQLDIPFTAFTGLLSREHLAQLIVSGTGNTVFLDNIYFHK